MTFHFHLGIITTFVFDMDGVLTDGSLFATGTGELARRFQIKDGYALKLAIQQGYRVAVISGGKADSAEQRFKDLGIPDVFMGVIDKAEVFKDYLFENDIDPRHVLYMGDDLPDYGVMELAGLPVCPADACREIKDISQYISPFRGGEGCVRDVIEKVLKVQDKWS